MTNTDMTFTLKMAMGDAQRDLAAFGQAWRKVGVETRSAMQVAAEAGAGMRAPMASAERSAIVFAEALDRLEVEANRLRASLDPAYAATLKVARAQREFADAEEMAGNAVRAGIMSQAEATKMLDLLAAKHRAAAAAAEAMGDAARTSMQVAADSFAGVHAPIASAEESAKAFAASLDMKDQVDRMRAGLDPAFAATLNVARAQREFTDAKLMADNAVEAGLITEAEAVRMLDMLAAKQRAAAEAAVAMGAQTSAAMTRMGATNAAVTGNVVAQLNDVWVMAAAGQNPLMTAIQQGSQLSQVFGNLGSGGGVLRTLGAAFMSLLSPTTLLTLGVVAGGAALIQWGARAIGAGDGAKTLEDRVRDLSSATRDYLASAKDAMEPLDELKKKYGELADEVQRARQAQANQRQDEARSKIDELIGDAGFRITGARPFEEVQAQADGLSALFAQVRESVNRSAEPTDAQISALAEMEHSLAIVQSRVVEYRDQLDALALDYETTRDGAEKLAIATRNFDEAPNDAAKVEAADALLRVMEQVYGSTMAADAATNGLASALIEAVKSGADIATAMEQAGEEAEKTAAKIATSYEEELAKQQGLAAIRRVIAQYGEDSAEAANAQATAARKAYQAEQEAAGQAGVHLDNLMKAWDAAQGVASVDIAGNVTLAADAAGRMAGNLVASVAALNQLNRQAVMKPLQRQQEAQIDLNTVGKPEERAVQHDVLDYRWSLPDGGYGAIASGVDTSALRLMAEGEEAVRRASSAAAEMARDAAAADAAWAKLISGAGAGGGGGGGGAGDTSGLTGLQKQATEALTGLDTAIAAIHEKLRAGLMTTAEAEDAVGAAKVRAAESLAELIAQMERLGPAGQAAAQQLRQQMQGVGADVKAVGAALSTDLSEGFKGSFAAFLAGTKSAKDAMTDFADHVKAKLAEMAAEEFQLKVIAPVVDKISGSLNGVFQFADGGAPDAPALAARRNQVLDRPTIFPMAGGQVGLMAEAGPEAIMPVGDGGVLAVADGQETRLPLTRGAGGRLGVDVSALAGNAVTPFAKGGVPGTGVYRQGVAVLQAVFDRLRDATLATELPEWRPPGLERLKSLVAPIGQHSGVRPVAAMDAGYSSRREAAPVPIVNIHAPAGHEGRVVERPDGGTSLDVVFDRIDDYIARNLRAGTGSTHAALADVMGLNRRVR